MLTTLELLTAADHHEPLPTLPPGAACREVRRDARLSADMLAVAVGVSTRTLERWETGQRPQSPQLELRYRRVLRAIYEAVGGDGRA